MLWLVIICLLLQGFAIGGQLVPGMLDMLNSARWHGYPDDFETYGLIAGLFHSCVALGAFAGPSLGGFLYEAVGFPWSSTIIAAFQLFTLICTLLYILTHIRVEVMNEVPEHAFTAVVDTDDDETRALLKGKDGKLYAGQCELTRSGEVIFYGSQQEEKGGKGEADTEIGRGGAEEAESDVDAKMT
ncbi:PREDICTED: MFS-type transporter SLC18B1-like [Priapulus caudatus]|uniref:MFS-type transporter SLC18B1-like n=1 Tax=Priapulus caudatus TaxID=37621 RepID=A0ABM1F556_PRICU|nr:PREDICTED: MFS-type transporter SLC18B1-like [Priapulus caudatus]